MKYENDAFEDDTDPICKCIALVLSSEGFPGSTGMQMLSQTILNLQGPFLLDVTACGLMKLCTCNNMMPDGIRFL